MTILSVLLQISLISAILYAAIMLFKTLFKKYASPVLHYLVWFLLIARLLIPVTVDVGFRFFTLPSAVQQQTDSPAVAKATAPSGIPDTIVNEPISEIVPLPYAGNSDPVAENAATSQPTPFQWSNVLLLAWLSGAAFFILQTLTSSIRLQNRLKSQALASPSSLLQLAHAVKAEYGIKADLRVVVLADIVSPALSAGFYPRVILPEKILGRSEESIIFALRHECMHQKRKDHLVCLLLSLLRAVYWFNPVVWLAFRQIKLDMETACDSMVVKAMDADGKRRYAQTILQMAAENKKAPAMLGMALQNTKKSTERRIRGIFMQPTSGKKTKLAATFLSIVIAVTCFTTACQPVAATPTAAQTSTPAQASAVPTQEISSSQAVSSPFVAFEAPPSYQTTFQANDEKVTISVDAPITLPDATEYSVYEMTPGELTADFVQKAADVLMEGKELYAPPTATKAELAQQIEEVQKKLAEQTTSDATDANSIAAATQLQQELDIYQQKYKTAPDTYTPQAASMQFVPRNQGQAVTNGDVTAVASVRLSDGNGNVFIADEYDLDIAAELDNGYHGSLRAVKYTGEKISNSMFFSKSRPPDDYSYPPCTISQDEAYQMALNLLNKMGITGMSLYSCAPPISPFLQEDTASANNNGYDVQFRRSFGGMPVISTEGGYTNADGIQVASDEIITVEIRNDEIIFFNWENPVKEIKTVEQNITLLPFNKVMDIFKREMAARTDTASLISYLSNDPNFSQHVASTQSGQVNITRAELGLVSINVPGQPGVCRLIPAWKFYGTDQITKEVNGIVETHINYQRNGLVSYLTINAMDGSIIDNDE